jgi:hypothetical protein
MPGAASSPIRLIVLTAVFVAGAFPANATVTRPALIPVERIATVANLRAMASIADNSSRPGDPRSTPEIDLLVVDDDDDDDDDDEGFASSALLDLTVSTCIPSALSPRFPAATQPVCLNPAANALHLRC